MTLTPEIIGAIRAESDTFLKEINESSQYGTLTPEQRKELGAFYTPADLVIQMLEMYDCTLEEFATKTILDPTCGSGNLLMGALIAGCSVHPNYPEKVFGNELADSPLDVCRKRFVNYCSKRDDLKIYDEAFWKVHLHQGNALNKDCVLDSNFVAGYSYNTEKDTVKVAGRKFTLNKKR